jgi:putative membrane protein
VLDQLPQALNVPKMPRRVIHLVNVRRRMMNGKFLALMLALPMAAFAADPDASFYKHAAEGGLFEVQAGQIAQTKGNSQQVKDFGGMMVKDHTAANDKLQQLAASKSITLPTSPSVGQMAVKAKLDVLSGDTFDKSYVKGQVKAHRDTISLFHKEINSGQDPDAKAFATATLPTLRAHFKAINAIAADMGVSTK